MDIIIYIAIFSVSLIVLLKSSDFFVDSAEKIGLSFGISPFIIGVTIVAFGTSLPELATSIVAVLSGTPEIVGGTVIGSNITNILLVLGVTLIVSRGIKLGHNIWDLDMPLLLISALFMWFVVGGDDFGIVDGILFCLALLLFLLSSFQGKMEKFEETEKAVAKDYIFLILGGVGVSIGANYVVESISELSRIVGIPPDIISLSVLALGTSLPEVMVSIAAARKGKSAMAVGNVLGSNIFNTYAVLGITRMFGELKFTENMMSFSIPFMIAVTFFFAISTISGKINKWEGWMLILMYIYYLSTLLQ